MAQVNYVLTDITYESSVNPNMKFNLTVRAYDATDQTGDTVENRYFINGAVDGKDVMSDCLSTANQPQSAHCILRSENDWVISGDDYHLIEALASACDAATIADVEETLKDENNDDIVIAQRYSKKANDDTVMAEVWVQGIVTYRTSFKLSYTTTSYDDNDIAAGKISNSSKPNLAAAVEQAKTAVTNDDVVRLLITPDPVSGIYSAGKISYKYTTTWDFRAEQNEQDKLWHAYVTFSLLYGTDDVSQEFRKRDFDFSKHNLYRAESAMQSVMEGLLDKMYDMFDKLSGVKFAINTNGQPDKDRNWVTEEITVKKKKRTIAYLRSDNYDQLVTAFSRPKSEKSLVLEAEAYAPNYDGTVRCLLQMVNGILVDKTGVTWTSEGSPTVTQTEAKFDYGLLLSNAARMKCGDITLGGTDITVDFFAYIPSSSVSGRIFYWGDINTFLELRYDSSTKNVVMACKEGTVSSKQEDISYGAETVCDQNFHYAITYSFANKELILFVDGVKMGVVSDVTVGTFKDNTWQGIKAGITLGESTRDFSVIIDEFRVSDGLNRWPVPKRDPGKVVDAAGGEWLVKTVTKDNQADSRKNGCVYYPPTDPLTDPAGILNPATDTKYGTGIAFEQFNYIVYTTPILLGGSSSPEGDFTIDFFITPTSTQIHVGGILELNVGNATKPSYNLGFHIPGCWCVHDTINNSKDSVLCQAKCIPNEEVYCAIQYNATTKKIQFYFNGTTFKEKSIAGAGLNVPQEFSLVVGRYLQGGNKGYFAGKIDQLRITKGKRLWTEENAPGGKFTPPTEPYNLESEERDPADNTKPRYTKAFLTSAALQTSASATGSDVSNPNRIFTPPSEPYGAVVNAEEALGLKEFYVPLVPYFDDSNLTAIERLPRQKEPYPEYDGLVHEPEWLYYDANNTQLEISGVLSGFNAQTYYAFFEPKTGYCWKDGSTIKKRVPWYIKKVGVGQMPRQDEPLVYNAAEQDVNLVNFDAATMVLSGRVRAMAANTIDTPYYYCIVTLKDNLSWPTGTSEPYEVPWEIIPQPVALPVLAETSSLSFIYNGAEQGPVFVYNSDLITVTGDIRVVDANASNADILLTEEYCITFSLKDKQNYCWNYREEGLEVVTENETSEGDIYFFWRVKRYAVAKPTFSGGPFTYSGVEQGPTVEGLNETYCQISGHKATDPGYYVARVVLIDPDNCEWLEDGTTGDIVYNWEIPMQKGQISLVPDTLNLRARKGMPVPSATVQVTRLGNGKIIVTENPKVKVEINGSTLTVYGLQNTGVSDSVTLTVSVEQGHGFDYEGVSAYLTVTVLRWLDALSWQEIAELATEDELLNGYSFIGDSKAVPSSYLLSSNQQCNWSTYKKSSDYSSEFTSPYCRVVLVGIDHNAAYEGDGRAHFLFYNNDDNTLGYLSSGDKLSHSDTATYTGGWRNSNIRQRYQSFEQFDYGRNTLPDDMVRYTIPVLKWTDNIGNGVNSEYNVFPTLDWLTLFSEKEVYGTNTYSNKGEEAYQERYSYFTLNPSDIKRTAYEDDTAVLVALRSPNATDTKKDVFVDTNGVLTSLPLTGNFSSDGRDCLLLFTVGNKRQDSLSIPAIDQHIVSLLHLKVPSTKKAWIVDECGGSWKVTRNGKNLPQDISSTVTKFMKTVDALYYNTEEHETLRGYNYMTEATLSFEADVGTTSLCCASFYAGTIKPARINGADFTLDIKFAHSNNDDFLFTVKSYDRAVRVYVKDNKLFCHLTDKLSDTDNDKTIQTMLTSTSNVWHHCALMCKETKLFLFLDGKGELVAENYSVKKGMYSFFIGYDPLIFVQEIPVLTVGDWHFAELRILDGVGAYSIPTTTGQQVFTPPTARYTNTEMLMYDHTIEGVKLSLTSASPVKVLNVTQHDGPLYVQSSDPTVVAAYTEYDSVLGCDTVTLEGISSGTSIVTIYTKDTVLTYGDIRTIEVTCDTSIAFKTLANCQPSEIRSIVKKGSATKAWVLGDKTSDISLSGTVNGKQISQTVKATVIGFDHNKQKESNGQFSVHLMLDPIEDIFVMNDEAVTEGGWKSSKMRNTTCSEIYAALPAAWKSVITPCTKYSDNSGTIDTDQAISGTDDNIWLLSNYEITGTVIASGHTITAFEGEQQKQYEYFKTAANRPSNTWLRTPEIKGTAFVSQGAATKTVFCFMISDYSAAELLPDNLCSFTDNNFVEYDGNIHYPEEDGIVRYLANAEHPTLYRQYYTFSGDISAQKSGYYFLRIKPAPGYLWNDGTATEVTVSWTILPADSTITPDKESLRAYCKNNYQDSVVLSRKAATTLKVTEYDTALISVTVNSNTVTVTALSTGKTNITITSPTDGNYKAVSVTLPVIASKIGDLSSLSPSQIQAAVIAGYAPLAWDPGDVTAPITVSGVFAGQDISGFYRAFILSCEHNTKSEGKYLHLCFGKTKEGDKILAFGRTALGNTQGGWKNSSLRTQIQSLISCFPKAWRDVITNVCVKHSNTNVSNQSNTTKDKVWLLAQEEIFSYPNDNIKQYDYFACGNQAIAYRQEYPNVIATIGTRTVATSNAEYWVGVSTEGKETTIHPTQKVSLLPCFAIGTTKESSGLSVEPETIALKAEDTTTLTVQVNKGVTYSTRVDAMPGTSDYFVEVTESTIPNVFNIVGNSIGTGFIVVTTEETETYAQDTVSIPVTVTAKEKTDPVIIPSYSILNIIKGSTAALTVDVTGGNISSVTTEDTNVATVIKQGSSYRVTGVNEGITNVTIDVKGDLSHNDVIKKIPVHVGAKVVTLSTLTQAASNLVINNPTYNGQEWDLRKDNIIAGYNQKYHELSGDVTAVNHNAVNYSVQVSPMTGFQWFDKTTETKNLSWNVNKAAGILIGTDALTLTKTTRETVTETYTITEGSTLSVKNNSHASLITVTISGNKVTFASSCSSNVTANVTLQVTETNNYTIAELAVEVTVRDSALEIIPAVAGKDKLSVSKAAVTYDKNTTLTVDSSWISNFSNDYHRISKVTKYANSIETVISNKKIKDAGTYRIYVSPAAGCAWDNTNDVDPVKLEYTINRKPIAAADEPVQSTSFTLSTGSVTPVASNFTYNSEQCVPATPFCSSQTTAGTFTGEDGAFFIPTSNYCWSDGSITAKSFPWTISSLTLLAKPTITTTSFVYDGTEKDPGIVTPDGMATYVTVTMRQKDPVVYKAPNDNGPTIALGDIVPVVYNNANKTTDGFKKEFGVEQILPVYKQTNAGVYEFTFTINDIHSATWEDSNVDPVKLQYTINRAEITATDEPALTKTEYVFKYNIESDLSGLTGQLQSPVYTAATQSNLGSNKKYTDYCEQQEVPNTASNATYPVVFCLTANYKWKAAASEDPYAPKTLSWKIVKAPAFLNLYDPNNHVSLTPVTSIDLKSTEEGFSKTFKILASGSNTWSKSPINNSSIIQYKFDNTNHTITVSCFRYGHYTCEYTIRSTTYFEEGTGSIPVNLSLEFVTVESKKPWTFIINFLRCLTWNNTAWQVRSYDFSNPNEDKTITNFGGYESLDDAVNIVTRGSIKTTKEILDKMKKIASEFTTTNAGTIFNKYYGMNLSNTDAGLLWGFDMGASSSPIDASAAVPETGTIKTNYPSESSIIEGVKFIWPVESTLTEKQKFIVKAMDTWWLKNSIQLIKQYYDLTLAPKYNIEITSDLPTCTVKLADPSDSASSVITMATMNSSFYTQPYNVPKISDGYFYYGTYNKEDTEDKSWQYKTAIPSDSTGNYRGAARACSWTMTCSGYTSKYTSTSSNDGVIAGVNIFLDQVILHEMVHGVMFSNIHGHVAQPLWFAESIADLITGNDSRSDTYEEIAKSATRLQEIYDGTYEGVDAYVFGCLMLKYLIKNYCTTNTTQPSVPT